MHESEVPEDKILIIFLTVEMILEIKYKPFKLDLLWPWF